MKRFWMAAAVLAAVSMGSMTGRAQATPAPATPAPTAPATPMAGGIDGKWHFALDTPGGERDSEAEFKVDADGKVTGTWGNSSVGGTFKDGKLALAFSFTSDEAGETAQMKIDGTLEKGVITGKWSFSSYDGDFSASRPKE